MSDLYQGTRLLICVMFFDITRKRLSRSFLLSQSVKGHHQNLSLTQREVSKDRCDSPGNDRRELSLECFKNTQSVLLCNIASFVFTYFCSFRLCWDNMILVNVKLDASKYNRIVFQCYTVQWSSRFLMAQLKRSWQHWQPCIERHF